MDGMARNRWDAVAAAVTQRRVELNMTQAEAATAGSVSDQTWSSLENARQADYRELSLAGVCRALGWTVDSIDRILRGQQPLYEDSVPHPVDHNGSEGWPGWLEDKFRALEDRVVHLESLLERVLEHLELPPDAK